jgi:hypothetical protein
MKTLAIICSIVLVGFTCFVTATDGPPDNGVYIAFSLALLVIPAFTVFVLSRTRAGGDPVSGIERLAAAANIALLAFVVWAIADQYPHPKEEGVLAFMVLATLTPILSAAVLFRRRFAHA